MAYASVVRTALAVGLATAAYGVSFGALAVASGLDVWQACVLSALMFTGGSQFALVGVFASGGVAAGWSGIASASLLGLRNAIYGVRMAPIVGGPWWRRLLAAQLTIDESTAVALAQEGRALQRVGFWATGIAIYLGWNLTTLVGALLGSALGDPRSYGLDAAAAAAFLALLWPRLRTRESVAVAVAAALIATLCIPVLAPGLPVLVAAAAALAVALPGLLRRRTPSGPGHSSAAASRGDVQRPSGPGHSSDVGRRGAAEGDDVP